MEASEHTFEPLLFKRPEHAHGTTDQLRVDRIRPRIDGDNFTGLVVHPHEPTVEIPPFHPLGTQLAARVAIGITTRILGQLSLPGLELLLSVQGPLRLLEVATRIDVSRDMIHAQIPPVHDP